MTQAFSGRFVRRLWRSASPGIHALGLSLGGLLGSPSLKAEEPVEFAVEYSAPAACPTVNDFVRAVTLRVPAARPVPSLSAKTRFRVALAPSEGGVSGTLTVFVAGADPSERQVPGAACEDAVIRPRIDDGTVFMVRYGDAVIYAGDPCNGLAGCRPVPPAVAALEKVLQDLDAQELARGECLAIFPR